MRKAAERYGVQTGEGTGLVEISSLPTDVPRKVHEPHFMLVPSLACPALCSYCFGPHEGPTMPAETMEASLDFVARIAGETRQRKVKVTFHGGEPLMAGHAIWKQALDGLRSRFGPRRCEVAVQSNLWLLDDDFCHLFREHQVDIGTSLDGPREVTDAQRGEGYFDRTMAGIRRAQAWGMRVGCIATFTPANAPRWWDVFDFFFAERLGFSVHPSVPPLGGSGSSYSLTAGQYASLLRSMLDRYVECRHELSISSIDQMCQGVGRGEGKVCTFRDCLGMFLAVDPSGDIFACQRFAGRPPWRLGTLSGQATLDELLDSSVARAMAERERRIAEACGDCPHTPYCRGGCPYNAWAAAQLLNADCGLPSEEPGRACILARGIRHSDDVRDPYCPAYRATFGHITARLGEEMGSEENIDAVAASPYDGRGHPLLKKGALIELVREGPHPSKVARTARRIVAAVELARGPDIPTVAARLVEMGVCRSQQSGEASLAGLQRDLQPTQGLLNNLYLHVTFRCQLECTHCYARADAHGHEQRDMPVRHIEALIREAKEAGFRQVVLTGGEPLIHKRRDELLTMLTDLRPWTRPMNLVLRTNLAMPLDEDTLTRIAAAVDQVVVSVDGNEQTHDERRGKGTYSAVVRNIEAYADVARAGRDAGELSLAAVMHSTDIQGEPGDSVRELARWLGVKRTRFRPLLPLGRASAWDEPPASEALGGHADPMELIAAGFRPVSTCGIGQNLYVEPSGESFPCYAYHRPHSYIGNIVEHGLRPVLESEAFSALYRHNVDTNPKCRACDVRYLCGGACRAWGGDAAQHDLDAAPTECRGLHRRAVRLLEAAKAFLGSRARREGAEGCSSG